MNSKKIKKYLQDDIYFQKIKNKKLSSNNNLITQNKFKNIHNKTKNVKINFLNTNGFKNIIKENQISYKSNVSSDHSLKTSDQTKSSDTRYSLHSNKNKVNILNTEEHKDYMKNLINRLKYSLNNKNINLHNNKHNLNNSINSHNNNNINNNINHNYYSHNISYTNNLNLNSSSSNNSLTNISNLIIDKKNQKIKNHILNNKKSGKNIKKSISEELLNNIIFKQNNLNNNNQNNNNKKLKTISETTSSYLSEDSIFNSKPHSTSNTLLSKSLKNSGSSSLNEKDDIPFTYSDDETNRSNFNKNNLLENNNFDFIYNKNQNLIGNINKIDFKNFYEEMNKKLFGK